MNLPKMKNGKKGLIFLDLLGKNTLKWTIDIVHIFSDGCI